MSTVIDELVCRLGFTTDPKGLEGFAKLAEDGKKAMLALGAATAGAVYGLTELVKGTAERMGGIANFSEQMGISAREVAALGKVAADNDSSLESMEGSLRTLSQTAGQAAAGIGRGALLFKKYGLHAKDAAGNVKSIDVLLGDVAEKMSGMKSLQEQQALGARLGFDPAMIVLLSKGRAEIEKLRAQALKENPFADSDYELADKTDKAFQRASRSVTTLKNRLAVGLMPAVQDLLDRFTKWISKKENIEKIQSAIGKVKEVVMLLVNNLGKVASVAGVFLAHKLGAKILELSSNFGSAARAAGSLKLAMSGAKALLTGGLAGAIALVAEDLWVFYHGGESVTGWLEEKWPGAVDGMLATLDLLSAAFLGLATGSGPVGVFVFALGGIVIAIKAIHDAWTPLVQWMKESLRDIGDRVRLIAKIVTPAVWLIGKATGTADKIYGKDSWEKAAEESDRKTREETEAANERMRKKNGGFGVWLPTEQMPATWNMLVGVRHPVAPAGQAGTVINGGLNVTVSGSGDPQATADAVLREMDKRVNAARASGGQRDAARTRARNAGAMGY